MRLKKKYQPGKAAGLDGVVTEYCEIVRVCL